MEPTFNPSLMFFLLVPLLISLNLPTFVSADDARFTNCSSNYFHCGDFESLTYPFWGDDRAEYCGPPDFQLKCEGNIPKIIIQSLQYRILDLDWSSQILTVVRDDYQDTICPSVYKNNTFDSTMFQYVDTLVNMTILYDCFNATPPSNASTEGCYRDAGTYSIYTKVYYSPLAVYVGNCKSVIMPIQATQLEDVMNNQLQAAIVKGFGLQWMVNNEQCDTCTKSGGGCSYDSQFSCFCKEGPQNTSCFQGHSESTKKLGPAHMTAIAISIGVGGIALISILIIYICKKHLRIENRQSLKEIEVYHDHNLQSFMKNRGTLAPRQYSYSEVKRMTKSFSDKLGEGGYGVVYKASLPDGHLVAVKVIRKSKASGEEFINEVASISRTSHVNIITLLGFCYERNKRALAYEYMSNGSLDNFTYKRGSPTTFCTLEWKVLYQVAIGITRGLEYLHRGCNTRILHLDIKPQNILLDEEFCPKTSDFGLAKICQKKESIVSIVGTRGTIGFIAPEIFNRAFGGVSHKSDVYSYGMLVLEMVGGRKNYDSGGSHTDEMYFPDWIYKDLQQGNHPASSLEITEEENVSVRKMTLVSLWCIQTNPFDRPIMRKVVEMLEGPLQSLSFPPKPSWQYPKRSSLQLLNESFDEIIEINSTST